MKDFRDLQVWRKAHELALAIYPATRAFPDDERFGETSQIRRAAASIPKVIAAKGCVATTEASTSIRMSTIPLDEMTSGWSERNRFPSRL